MKSRIKKIGFVFKAFLLFFSVFIIAFFITFMVIENNHVESVLDEIKLSEEVFVERQSDLFLGFLKNVFSDLKYISDSFDMNRRDILDDWKVVLESSGTYNKIRYIDLSGREVIRMDYFNGNAFVINSEDFLNVKDEDYFSETIGLEKGQLYVSKINKVINKNHPEELSIMFCTPVYIKDLEGILVLDFNVRNMFDELSDNMGRDIKSDEVYLVNDYGYWLLSENNYKEVDVGYYDIAYDIGILPAEKWNDLKQSGHNITENGLYSFKEINYIDCFGSDEELAQNTVVFQAAHCKVSTLIKSGLKYDYYFYNDFSSKLVKIISTRYIYILVCFFVALLTALFINANKSKFERIQDSSNYDPLTKVYNRRQGFIELEQRVSNIGYYRKMCICFIDIDGLKEVNDTLGHDFGDELIITVSDTIKNTIRDQDLIIRMGGDEFLIAFMKVEKAIAETIWCRITEAFKAINSMEDRGYIISASHGIVEIKSEGEKIDLSALITRADGKMYEEKTRVKKTLTVIRKKF